MLDLVVIGGGINGSGIALDAAGRGLNVLLCDKSDLASGTSSNSSKLIHGGLRYLEHYEFRLVKEALAEREVLLGRAPHLIEPMRFTMPHRPHLRPTWLIRSGLFLYDHLSRRNSLPSARQVDLNPETSALLPEITSGFRYYDCWVDDARMVVQNVKDAARLGAKICVRSACEGIKHQKSGGFWEVIIDGQMYRARGVINATGPWLNHFIEDAVGQVEAQRTIRLIKGSHIIVPRIHGGEEAYILQNEDKRIVFVLPYLDEFTLIGTTDKEYKGSLDNIEIDQDETDYLLDIYNRHFVHALSEDDIVHSYSGVRPLCNDESDDPSAITRDYTLDLQTRFRNPFLSIYGGKITTYRKLAEAALEELKPYFPHMGEPWTATTASGGADALGQSRTAIEQNIEEHFPWLAPELIKRFARTYGLDTLEMLGQSSCIEDLGQDFGARLHQIEIDYLVAHEWAASAEDVLERRTKHHLYFDEAQKKALEDYIALQLNHLESQDCA